MTDLRPFGRKGLLLNRRGTDGNGHSDAASERNNLRAHSVFERHQLHRERQTDSGSSSEIEVESQNECHDGAVSQNRLSGCSRGLDVEANGARNISKNSETDRHGDGREEYNAYHSCDDSYDEELSSIGFHPIDSERESTPCGDSAYDGDNTSDDAEDFSSFSKFVHSQSSFQTDEDNHRPNDSLSEDFNYNQEFEQDSVPVIVEDENFRYCDSERELYTPYDESFISGEEEETFEEEDYCNNTDREPGDLSNFDEDDHYEDVFEDEDPDIGYWNPFEEAQVENSGETNVRASFDGEESASDAVNVHYGEIHYYECWGRDDGINDETQAAAQIISFHEEEEPHEALSLERNARHIMNSPGALNPLDGQTAEQMRRDSQEDRNTVHDNTSGIVVEEYSAREEAGNNVDVAEDFFCDYSASHDSNKEQEGNEAYSIHSSDSEDSSNIVESCSESDASEEDLYSVNIYDSVEDENRSNSGENDIIYYVDEVPNFSNDVSEYQGIDVYESEREEFTVEERIPGDVVGCLHTEGERVVYNDSSNEDEEVAKLTERMTLKEIEDKENCKDSTESEASGTSFRETALQEALKTLQKENEKYRESQMCKVCLNQEIQMVFIPCGHLATCFQCSHHLYCCPLCRRGILNKIRVYKS